MEDEFDYDFEDELEALQDLETDSQPKGRRSLNFSTPRTQHVKSRVADSNTSINEGLGPLEISTDATTPTQPNKDKRLSQKRRAEDVFSNLSDDEKDENSKENNKPADNNDMPDISKAKKRARTCPIIEQAVAADFDDEFEVSPPASPSTDEISRIKKQNQINAATVTIGDRTNKLVEGYDTDRLRVLSRIPETDFVFVTSSEGRRVYMKLREEEDMCKEADSLGNTQATLSLLGTPLAVLKAQLEEERHRRMIMEAQELSQTIQHDLDGGGGGMVSGGPQQEEEVVNTKQGPGALWVERYSPQKYTELLSDEATNRLLLKWLKLWDHVVFNKEKKVKPPPTEKEIKKEAEKKPYSKQPEMSEDLDDYDRPMQKVALLCGPPGLGKTTLAHVIARHAGYNVVEMNASDDRSVDAFRQRIEAATQMRAVMGADPRPNCLVIDEIDGAPLPAINYLLTVIKNTGQQAGEKKRRRKGGADSGLLLRPIICICNDLYVPSLRQLRQVALTVTFPPTLPHKLATRLMEISRFERLKTDLTTLLALCEKSDNDIRSCLNTLQFVRSKCEHLGLKQIQSTNLGQKDAHKSLFLIWKHIFSMPRAQRKRYVNPYDRSETDIPQRIEDPVLSQNPLSLTSRFASTHQLAMASGETEKLHQGLYENYLDAKVKDPHLDGLLLASEWMTFNDILNQEIAHSQNYQLMRYISYLPVAFHLLFASNQPHKIHYPSAGFEFHTKHKNAQNLVSTLVSDVAPSVRKNLNVTVTVTEYLPPLMDIIQPNLRPVNTQLYSKREKAEMQQLIQTMIAYNLNYNQERGMDGQYNYVLDPHVDDLVRYPEMKQKRQLTYAAKQLISREIEVEQMRRKELPLGSSTEVVEEVQAAEDASSPSKVTAPVVPNHRRQMLVPKSIEGVEKVVPRDFFGRTLTVKTQAIRKKKENPMEEVGGDIWFRFKEGYSNAVRKNIRISDLM